MKIINDNEFENLKEEGARLIGKIIPYDLTEYPVIYFYVSPEEENLPTKEMVKTVYGNQNEVKGQFDVIRNWSTIQVVTIEI